MKSPFSRPRLASSLVALAAVVGVVAACTDDDTHVVLTPDGGTPPGNDASVGSDTGTTSDSGAPIDSGADAKPEVKPVTITISPTGHDRFFGLAYDAAGNLYATGQLTQTTDATEDVQTVVAKITPAGALDTTFGAGGIAKINLVVDGTEQARGIVVQSTGKIVVAATVFHPGTVANDRDFALARLDANGTVDATFGTNGNGIVIEDLSTPDDPGGTVFDAQWGLALGASDALFVEGAVKSPTGADSDFAILKLDANGARDATFGTSGLVTVDVGGGLNASARNLRVLADGSVLASGYFRNGTLSTDPVQPVLIKRKPNGDPDDTFGVNGVYTELIYAVAFEVYGTAQQGTSFVTAGYGRNGTTESEDWLSLRITATGTRDMTWGTGGIARVDFGGQTDNARNILALPDGRFVIVGAGRSSATNQDAMIGMLTANGRFDTTWGPKGLRTFDTGGAGDHFWGAAVSPNGKTLAIGGIAGAKDGGNDDALVYLVGL